LLYDILFILARIINLCDHDIATLKNSFRSTDVKIINSVPISKFCHYTGGAQMDALLQASINQASETCYGGSSFAARNYQNHHEE
jgi:hypothetical protein